MKKCVLVNCFGSSNENRVEPIKHWFEENGYETIYYSSDFHHVKKEYVELPEYIEPIKTKKYKKNISVQRIVSHVDFSKKIYALLKEIKPDVLYVKFPPNSLVKYAAKFKRKFGCYLIFDVFDLWPESLPVSSWKKTVLTPLTYFWARPRNKYLKYADLVLTECDMYREVLDKYFPDNTATLYLSKKDIEDKNKYLYGKKVANCISLCYLGGINSLIDIELIGKIISRISKNNKVTLDIIGDGVSKEELIETATANGAEVKYHGIIYDEDEKLSIMSKCDFGLNIIKEAAVKIALSIKSIEYFRAGLAVINNVPYDSLRIIESENAGINVNAAFFEDKFYLSDIELNEYKLASRRVYEKYFSDNVFLNNLNSFLENLVFNDAEDEQ